MIVNYKSVKTRDWNIAVSVGVLFLFLPNVYAQIKPDSVIYTSDSLHLTKAYFTNQYELTHLLEVNLPSLDTLQDAAIMNSPNLGALQKNIDIRKSELKTANREWLRYLGPSASYGVSNSSFLSSSPDIFANQGQQYGTNKNTFYSIGASLSIPLQTIMDWGNRRDLYKSYVQQAEYNRAQYVQDLKRQVVGFYSEAFLSLSLLRSNVEAVGAVEANRIAVEANFASGKVTTAEYGEAKQNELRVNVEFENTKARLREALMMLDVICGIHLYVEN